jgi:hypothetical protein
MSTEFTGPHYLEPLGIDFQAEMDSLQSFYNTDSKKLTQLNVPSRQPGDISFFSRTDPIDCTFTSVSSDESKFLEDFMTFASDFGGSSKERPSLTELTVCDRTGNLSRPGQPEVQAACTVTSLASLPGQYGSGSYGGQHQHRDKYPAKKRVHSYTSSPSKVLKVSKPRSSSAGESGLAIAKDREREQSGGTGSLLRQQLQGTLCASKYKTALTAETLCKDCGMPFTTKCLLQVCRKSDEVLCTICGQELTCKCLLNVCSKSDSARPGSV